jgi:methionyl-tRNA formyltransferase
MMATGKRFESESRLIPIRKELAYMNVSILTQPTPHPVHEHLQRWSEAQSPAHEVEIKSGVEGLHSGDVLFIVSSHEVVPAATRAQFAAAYVLHASRLPHGRGWSPVEWQVADGESRISVSLIVAEDEVDAGGICSQVSFDLNGHELRDEIFERVYEAELDLMSGLLDDPNGVIPVPQTGEPSWYRRRDPSDSLIDPNLSLAEQFDLLRVVDNDRFPAYFNHRGCTYTLKVEKLEPRDASQ